MVIVTGLTSIICMYRLFLRMIVCMEIVHHQNLVLYGASSMFVIKLSKLN
jgi:hypothetical protein